MKSIKLEWTYIHQKAFDDIKRIMAAEIILDNISQGSKPLALYSRRLSGSQMK